MGKVSCSRPDGVQKKKRKEKKKKCVMILGNKKEREEWSSGKKSAKRQRSGAAVCNQVPLSYTVSSYIYVYIQYLRELLLSS